MTSEQTSPEPTSPEHVGRDTVAASLRSLLRPPHRRQLILTLITAVLTAGVCWYIGMDTWHAIIVVAAITAVGLCWVAVPDHESTLWAGDTAPVTDGARRDIVQLSWSVRPRYGRIPLAGLGRVQNLARYRLALRGLDLRDPNARVAIEALIGRAAYVTLRATEHRLPLLRSVVHCLDRLDELDPARSADKSVPDKSVPDNSVRSDKMTRRRTDRDR